MKRTPPEGSIFLVPLRDRGFAIGVLARASGKGKCYGYFFGPRIHAKEDVKVENLIPENPILVGQFGDLELLSGNWKVIDLIPDWLQNRWPMKPLARVDEAAKRAWLSFYDDALNCTKESEITVEEAKNHPYDRMMGAGAVEIRLTALLEK
ncbi:MAG: immunity 26/phosphotriesterase HocA family protein [Planctomycetes bacterium]|nr:immunity 26/phosphotriesterase HocA family protein [Planctomycetota bacterium]